jgi:hypothetical protein
VIQVSRGQKQEVRYRNSATSHQESPVRPERSRERVEPRLRFLRGTALDLDRRQEAA